MPNLKSLTYFKNKIKVLSTKRNTRLCLNLQPFHVHVSGTGKFEIKAEPLLTKREEEEATQRARSVIYYLGFRPYSCV